MLYCNSGSTPAHFDEIHAWACEFKPIVLCISETHLTEDILMNEVCIKGYECLRVDSDSRHTGGVQMYIQNGIKIGYVNRISLQKKYWLLYVKVNICGKVFLLACVYRSPNGGTKDFLDFFETWIDDIVSDVNVPILMVGDFNLDWFSENSYSKRLKNILNDISFNQLINEITRPTPDGGTLIDLVCTNQRDIKSRVLKSPRISDHYNILIEFPNTYKSESLLIQTRGRNIKYELINSRLLTINWKFHVRDVNTKCDLLINNILKILNEVAPIRQIKIKPYFKPWWNENVRQAVQLRDSSYKTYRADKTNDNLKYYKANRNNVVKVIRKEKQKYFECNIDNFKNNPSHMWRALKELIPKSSHSNIREIIFDNGTVDDPVLLPDKVNKFYVESIDTIVGSINSRTNAYSMNDISSSPIIFDTFQLITHETLKEIVFSLKNKSSPDEIHIQTLKNIYNSIECPLLNLINSSLEQGVFPQRLKLSTIIPVQKKDNLLEASNFRPINVLFSIEKVLEKIVYQQLLNFINREKILSVKQSGFRKGHSCETAIQCVIDEWKILRDNGYSIVAVFLDLRRAFETIDRQTLIIKLKKLGLCGTALKWIESYLCDRKQRVKINDIMSDTIENKYGVPQGSVLGPLLFILYINDIVDVVDSVEMHLFADDTLLYVASKNVPDLVNTANAALEKIYNYTVQNFIKVNASKTKFMLLSSEIVKHDFVHSNQSLLMEGKEIDMVNKIKYLGVIIDDKLSFKEHCNFTVSKISYSLSHMARCCNNLSMWAKLVIFNTLVLPHFNYCVTIMYMFGQNETNRLQKLQNRAMRIILGCDRYTSINFMFQALQWLPVSVYIKFNVLVFIFKIKNGLAPKYLLDKIVYSNEVHGYNTRQKANFFIPPRSKTTSMNSVFFKGLDEFNRLPTGIKCLKTLATFKKQLKIDLLNNGRLPS